MNRAIRPAADENAENAPISVIDDRDWTGQRRRHQSSTQAIDPADDVERRAASSDGLSAAATLPTTIDPSSSASEEERRVNDPIAPRALRMRGVGIRRDEDLGQHHRQA